MTKKCPVKHIKYFGIFGKCLEICSSKNWLPSDNTSSKNNELLFFISVSSVFLVHGFGKIFTEVNVFPHHHLFCANDETKSLHARCALTAQKY